VSVSRRVSRYGVVALFAGATLLRPSPTWAQFPFETVKALAGNGSEGAERGGPLAQTADGWIHGLSGGLPDDGPTPLAPAR